MRSNKRIPKQRINDIRFYHQYLKNKCEACRSKDNLTIHHRTPKDLGGLDLPDNMVTLCRICHDYVHKKGNQKVVLRLNYLISKNAI